MCFGCNPNQPSYTDETNQTIRICQKYAERLWSGKENNGAELLKVQSIYDTFGLRQKDGKDILIQSKDLKNAQDFFEKVKPPFFDKYSFEIVNSETNCFSTASLYNIIQMVTLTVLVISMFML